MFQSNTTRLGMALAATALICASPAYAWDPVRDLTGKSAHEHGRDLEETVQELGKKAEETAHGAGDMADQAGRAAGEIGRGLNRAAIEIPKGVNYAAIGMGETAEGLAHSIGYESDQLGRNIADAGRDFNRFAIEHQDAIIIGCFVGVGLYAYYVAGFQVYFNGALILPSKAGTLTLQTVLYSGTASGVTYSVFQPHEPETVYPSYPANAHNGIARLREREVAEEIAENRYWLRRAVQQTATDFTIATGGVLFDALTIYTGVRGPISLGKLAISAAKGYVVEEVTSVPPLGDATRTQHEDQKRMRRARKWAIEHPNLSMAPHEYEEYLRKSRKGYDQPVGPPTMGAPH